MARKWQQKWNTTAENNIMAETRLEITQRKIRNGLRKQREAVEREQMEMWEILKTDHTEPKVKFLDSDDVGYYYCPYIPIMKPGSYVIDWDTTA